MSTVTRNADIKIPTFIIDGHPLVSSLQLTGRDLSSGPKFQVVKSFRENNAAKLLATLSAADIDFYTDRSTGIFALANPLQLEQALKVLEIDLADQKEILKAAAVTQNVRDQKQSRLTAIERDMRALGYEEETISRVLREGKFLGANLFEYPETNPFTARSSGRRTPGK